MAVKISVERSFLLVSSDQKIFDESEAKDAVAKLKEQQEQRGLLIFDFSNTQEVALGALRSLTRALSTLAQYETKIAVVADKETQRLIREQGLDRLFSCHSNLSELVTPSNNGDKQRALEFLNTTLDAVAYTLQVSTNTKAQAGKSYIRDKGPVPSADIAATVGLVSAPFTGALILGFPINTYLGIMSRLLGQEYKELTPEIRDGAAELLNIILGQVKISLNEKGFAIKQAIPTVVQGDNVKVIPSSSKPSIIVPYITDIGDFYIELTTNPEGQG